MTTTWWLKTYITLKFAQLKSDELRFTSFTGPHVENPEFLPKLMMIPGSLSVLNVDLLPLIYGGDNIYGQRFLPNYHDKNSF